MVRKQKQPVPERLVTIVEMRKDFPLEKMHPFEDNPRINDHVVSVLEKSLGRFGPVEPIILDEDFRICAGETRWKAATARGELTFPAIVCRFADEAAFVGYNITSNRTAQLAHWNLEMLQGHIDDVLAAGLEVEAMGFDDAELAKLAADLKAQSGDEIEDDVPLDQYREQFGVIVQCESEAHQEEVYERLLELGYKCRVVTT